MPLTETRLTNIIGFLALHISKIQTLATAIQNPDLSAAQKLAMRQEAKSSFLKICKLCYTVADRQGWTIPIDNYTEQEMSEIGL